MRRAGNLRLALFFALVLANSVSGGVKEIGPASYSIGSALRFLSKGIFTSALAPDQQENSVDEYLRLANVQDSSDCVKRLICELHGAKKRNLHWDEKLIIKIIPNRIDYNSPIIQMQLAADLGKNNARQCEHVYSRCTFSRDEIMALMRQRGTSMDIKTNSEYDCTVLFLWNKKFTNVTKEE